MKLSLSVRIVESACKTRLLVPFEELVSIARETGYDAICMRASAAGVGTPPDRLAAMRRLVEDAGLRVSMVTADFDVPLQQRPRPGQPARHRAEPRRGRGAGLRPDPRLPETARGHRLRPPGGGAGRPARHPAGASVPHVLAVRGGGADAAGAGRDRPAELRPDLRAGQPDALRPIVRARHAEEAPAAPDERLRAEPPPRRARPRLADDLLPGRGSLPSSRPVGGRAASISASSRQA